MMEDFKQHLTINYTLGNACPVLPSAGRDREQENRAELHMTGLNCDIKMQ